MTIQQKFRSAIKRGTGEAHLIMKSNPKIDFSNDIIKASLTNFAYDKQSEGSRALYISELISLSKNQGKIRKAILKGLDEEQNDTWALVQLFDLATFFAKQGDTEAKRVIYKRFYNKIIEGSDWCGYDSILQLDKLEGLKYIAKTIGKHLEANPDDWQDSSIIRHFQDENPKIKVWQELKRASKLNSHIKIYLDNIKRTETKRTNYKRPNFNYEYLQTKIDSLKYTFIPPALTKAFSKSEIKKVAYDFLNEKDLQRKGKYLSIFSRIKFPYDYEPILKLAKGKTNNNDRIVEWSIAALKFFSGNDIRQFAIKKLNRPQPSFDFADLLIHNYKNEDYKLLQTIINKTNDEHTIHNLSISYVAIYQANKTSGCKEPLISLYNKLTCGLHRKDIIKIMLKNNVLPSHIKKEIKFDCNAEIRKL